MSQHEPRYLNGTILQQIPCVWPHIFQARQFKGKGDAKFDVGLILNEQQKQALQASCEQLAMEAFPGGEYNRTGAADPNRPGMPVEPAFQWPYLATQFKQNSPKLGEVFPGCYIITAKAYEDNPPQILIPDPNQSGAYIPMPESMRSQQVFDGALCYAGIDLASYESGPNVGIRVQLSMIIFYGAGTLVSVGSRPDAGTMMAGINVQMQAPAGMAQAGGQGGMPVQGVVGQQQPMQQQPMQQQPMQQQPMQQQPMQQQPMQQGMPEDQVPPVDFT